MEVMRPLRLTLLTMRLGTRILIQGPFRMNLFRKFALILAAVSLIPAGFLGYRLIGINHRGIQAAVLELHTKLAESLAEEINQYLKSNEREISFGLVSLKGQTSWPKKEKFLENLMDQDSDLIEIDLVGRKGKEFLKVYNPNLTSKPRLINHQQEKGLRAAFSSGQNQISFSKASQSPVAILYIPLAQTVVARVEISLQKLARKIKDERVGGTGFAVLAGIEGEPLLYPQKLSSADLKHFSSWPIVRSAVKALSVGAGEFKSNGIAYVGAYAPVSSLGGAVLILQKRLEAYSSEARMRKTAVTLISLVAFLSVLVAMLLARRLTRPLLSLTQAAHSVSGGDFSVRVHLETQDELRELAETFNRMAEKLKAYADIQVDRLIAEQRKTEAILYSIDEGIILLDQEKRLDLMNRRAVEFLNLPRKGEILGRPLVEILADNSLKKALLEIKSPAEDRTEIKEVELTQDINKIILQIISRKVLRPGEQEPGLLLALRDITLQRELDKMKEDFLHYVTHDLRNPLGSIMGFLEILLSGIPGNLTEDQRSILSSIQRSSRRLMGMINNILDIAKMESGKLALNLKKVSLQEIAFRAADTLDSLSKAKKISVKVDTQGDCEAMADGDLIERVFINLLGNAIKYTPQNGSITLSVEDKGDHFKAGVTDTGEGIPKEYLERVFLKFEQVEGKARGGTGLGLTISRFFVESHFGKIWVESELGKGSSFYFTIPKNLTLNAAGNLFIQTT